MLLLYVLPKLDERFRGATRETRLRKLSVGTKHGAPLLLKIRKELIQCTPKQAHWRSRAVVDSLVIRCIRAPSSNHPYYGYCRY
jgi:hypothetical protein